jgi:hypothetical protein
MSKQDNSMPDDKLNKKIDDRALKVFREYMKFTEKKPADTVKFTDRKLADTPTDTLSVVNRKYVNQRGCRKQTNRSGGTEILRNRYEHTDGL